MPFGIKVTLITAKLYDHLIRERHDFIPGCQWRGLKVLYSFEKERKEGGEELPSFLIKRQQYMEGRQLYPPGFTAGFSLAFMQAGVFGTSIVSAHPPPQHG